MKKLKNYLLLAILSLSVTSCLVDEDVTSDDYASGPNLAGFTAAKASADALATGDLIPFIVPVRVTGPTSTNIAQDVTITYAVNTAESTAVEGTHFQLNSTSTVLPASNNLFGNINIDIITAGIVPPLAVAPVLVLDIVSVSGPAGVLVNGRTGKIQITINYLCFSDLAGSYTNVTTRLDPAGGPYTWTGEVITQTGDGNYLTTNTGQYYGTGGNPGTGATAALAPTQAGYDFKDVCGNISVEEQMLGHVYSNLVTQSAAQAAGSFVNQATGVITIQYTIGFSSNTVFRTWRSVYTPN